MRGEENWQFVVKPTPFSQVDDVGMRGERNLWRYTFSETTSYIDTFHV